MKVFKKIFFVLTANIIFAFFFGRVVSAASLTLQPASVNVSSGQQFQVQLVLNVGDGESVWGYDAYIKFPSSGLTYYPASFAAGSVFATGGKTVNSASGDYVSVGGYFDTTSQGTTTGGVVATLTFSGSSAATGLIELVCNQFTNVYSSGANQTSLFTNCSTLLPQTSFVIAGAGGVTPTATQAPGAPTSTPTIAPTSAPGSNPTSIPQPTSTPTTASSSSGGSTTTSGGATGTGGQLTVLPETGMFDTILRLIYMGGGLIFVGSVLFFGFARIRRSDSHRTDSTDKNN